MSSRGNRPETEIEKQLKKLGFPDPKEREKKEKKERLVKKINLEFGINVDANETYEAPARCPAAHSSSERTSMRMAVGSAACNESSFRMEIS